MPENYQILGMKEAYRMLESLTAQEKQRIILGILRKGANKHIKNELKTRNVFNAARLKTKPFVTVNDRSNPLGILTGISGKYFFYRFSEFGTKQRFTRGKKKFKRPAYRGQMKRRPFVIQTIESNLSTVTNFFAKEYGNETKKRLERLARKKAKS